MMLWGSSTPTTVPADEPKEKTGHDDSHLRLISGDQSNKIESTSAVETSGISGRDAMPFFALDQLKQAGVPLKAQINPYLQMDPSIFRESQPQIIMPEGYEAGRGKFEFALGYIGCSVIGGFGVGSMRGMLGEFGNPHNKALAWNPWYTRVLNAATKHGSGYAQTAGTAMFLYSVTELGLKLSRADDLLNSFIAGPVAGGLYRGLPHGLRAGGIGAVAGLGLVTAWNLCDRDSRRELREILRLS
ncbi:hypothetical protein GPALN_003626 [Globodera pallida]|nr:hypothetical protein GPALN_003626 [Globodera pallida]